MTKPQNMVIVDGPGALAWARERLANSIRIAAMKHGADGDSWLEDCSYWRYIVGALDTGTPITIEDESGQRATLVSWDEPNLTEAEIEAAAQAEWRKWLG